MIENIEALNIGIVGGGRRCKALLEAIYSEKDPAKRPQVLAVADRESQAVGLLLARELGIFTTSDDLELCNIEELDLLLELTPDDSLEQRLRDVKPPGVLLVDHYDAMAILDHFRIKAKKIELMSRIQTEALDAQTTAGLFEEFHDFVQGISNSANAYARQMRHDLVSSRQSLSQIISGSTIPTFVIDRDHKVTHWNLACEKLTGYSAREMVGTDNQWKPFREDKRPTMADLILDNVSQEELWRHYSTRWEPSSLISGAYEVEEFFPHLGDNGTWLFFTAVPIKAPDGTTIGAIETLWDRTGRRQTEQVCKQQNTDLVQKVEQLRASQQTLAQIINGSTIPTFVIDKDHRVTHWNRALERLSGWPADKIVSTTKSWAPFYDKERPSMADVILDQIDEVQIEQLYGSNWRKSALIEGAYEAEAYFPHLGDKGKWCWFTAAPLKTPEGEVVGAIETIWDKTEERLAEEEREQHTRELATFSSIYATLSGPLDLEGRVKATVEEVVNIFDIDGLSIYIRKADNQFHLRYNCGFSDNLCYLTRVADLQSLVVRVARDGKTAVIQELQGGQTMGLQLLYQEGLRSLVYIPIADREKNTIGVIRAGSRKANHFGSNELRALELIANRIGVAIENAMLEQDIQQKASFQSRLISSSNNGIVATDNQWKVVIFNPAAESIFGYDGKAIIQNTNARDIYPADIIERFEAAMRTADSERWSLPWQETFITDKDGHEIPVRFSGAVLRQKHKKMGLVAFFQDLREIKRLEKELLGAERLAAVGQTVAGMAHCVKNILHGLKGGSYMVNIGIKKENTEKLQTGWNMVQRNITRTHDLVQDLLTYSKERQPEMAPCRPNEVVEEVMELMQAVAEEHKVALETDLSPEIGEVLLDERSLHRSLLNLVGNAIDACRDDPTPDKTHRVKVSTSLDGDRTIRFDVTDNGSGMSEEVKGKLFSSFFSTKGPQGTGLGLLVTSKLIEEHKGTIKVDSQLDQGTTFSIRLPMITET
ncbi:MAG: PAS domain S-box protein [Desulfobacteraceae bacterium]|jgi:PAS domain S-box-containing protein